MCNAALRQWDNEKEAKNTEVEQEPPMTFNERRHLKYKKDKDNQCDTDSIIEVIDINFILFIENILKHINVKQYKTTSIRKMQFGTRIRVKTKIFSYLE